METENNFSQMHKHGPKWFWMIFGILILIFLALEVTDKVHTIQQDFANTKPANTISISADGKVTATPDEAVLTLGVLSTESTANAAQDDNAKKINAITDFVKGQGIDPKNITTTQINVSPQYDYTSGNNKITGYEADQTISVKVEKIDQSTAILGTLIDGATNAGANQVQGVNLDFSDPNGLQEQAREMAIDNAKQKAQDLADKAGLKLGKIVSISESGEPTPVPLPFALNSAAVPAGGKSTAPDIEAGTQDITETMTVVFEVK